MEREISDFEDCIVSMEKCNVGDFFSGVTSNGEIFEGIVDERYSSPFYRYGDKKIDNARLNVRLNLDGSSRKKLDANPVIIVSPRSEGLVKDLSRWPKIISKKDDGLVTVGIYEKTRDESDTS